MFSESAELYDLFYSWKDYAAEAAYVRDRVVEAGGPGEGALLDVACGTGGHVGGFRRFYAVEGLDLDEGLLAVARRKHPDAAFHAGDMRDFSLGRRFDVVACLFSSIGYAKTEEGMRAAVACMTRHLRAGGALVLEPWFAPDAYVPSLHLKTVEEAGLKAARLSRSIVEDGLSVLEFHYVAGTLEGVRHFHERHELGLFTHEQTVAAMEACGLRVRHDPVGPTRRGLYVGVLPADG